MIRAQDGRILDATPMAELLYGYPMKELLARTVFELRSAATRQIAAAQLAVAEVRPVRYETEHQHRNGRRFRVEVSARGTMRGRDWVLHAEVRPLPDEPESAPVTAAHVDLGPRPTVWSPNLAVGIEAIDAQHRQICTAIDHLREGMKGHYLGGVPAVMRTIQRYVGEHFAAEESAMACVAFPGLAPHRAAHTAFATALAHHQAALSTSIAPSAVLELSSWLSEWIRGHIRHVDAEMGEFLRAQPPKSHA